MKKIFSILSVAVIALGLVACKKGNTNNDPEVKGKDFNMKVTNITATTADLTILPVDTTATYYVSIEPAEDLTAARLNIDSLAEEANWYIQLMITYAEMYGEEITYEDFLCKGKIEGEDGNITELLPETEYIAYAFKLNNQGKTSGELAYVAFKTKEVVPEKTETIQLKNALMYDVTEDGFWELLAAPADSSYVLFLSPDEAETIAGEYKTTDFAHYSWLYIQDGRQELNIIKADVNVAVSGTQANITGAIVASNMIQYDLDIKAKIEEVVYEDDDDFWGGYFAPARKKTADQRTLGFKKRPQISKK